MASQLTGLIRAVRHHGIVVSDLEKMLAFYRDTLGFTVAARMNESGTFIDELLGLQNVSVETVKLAPPEGEAQIELLKFHSHLSHSIKNRELFTLGPTHVALRVVSLDSIFSVLRESGSDFIGKPSLAPSGKAKVVFARDPEGNLLELVEVM